MSEVTPEDDEVDDDDLLRMLLAQCKNGWFYTHQIPLMAGVKLINHFDVHPESLGHAFDQLILVDELVFMIKNDLDIDHVASQISVSFLDDLVMPKPWVAPTTKH